ncbi:MAG: 1,4-dihydroxy-2-naphthoate polyprenyltransferase [Acidimicrobiales bacterium]
MPTELRLWVSGARPRTLPAAVAPVLVGSSAAVGQGHGLSAWRAVAALVVSLAVQVGANYANDYSDGMRGADATARRVGPVRLVGQGLAAPAAVKRAAIASFAVAALAGLALAAAAGWWLVLVGLACFAAAWFYTGGRRPYGYAGLGELFVFVFFGLVATVGSAYVQLERLSGLAVAAAVPVGLLITAILVANNLRDIPGDSVADKRTLAVRLGDVRTRRLYTALVGLALAATLVIALWRPAAVIALAAVAPARQPVLAVMRGDLGRELIPVLIATGRLVLIYGVLLAAGLTLSGLG